MSMENKGVKAKDIPGFLVEKVTSHLDSLFFQNEQKYLKTDRDQRIFGEGFNKGISVQGNRSIGLNREKLAEILYYESKKYFDKMMNGRNKLFKEWEDMDMSWKEIHYKTADAIKAAESTLIDYRGEE